MNEPIALAHAESDDFMPPIPGVVLLRLDKIRDHRGSFLKVYSKEHLASLFPHRDIVESFVTVSDARVLRGMHFQLPPKSYEKIVTCLQGAVIDILLDLRVGSPTFGQHREFRLSSSTQACLMIPEGIAHGFLVTDAPAMMLYQQSAGHAPELDAGIRWDSFGFRWPESAPVISARDTRFPALADFRSPFRFSAPTEARA